MIGVVLAAVALFASTMSSTTVTTLPPGPTLASGDPSNTTGLVVGIITTLVIAIGALVLYFHYRGRSPQRRAQ
jgi:hypothetical protein